MSVGHLLPPIFVQERINVILCLVRGWWGRILLLGRGTARSTFQKTTQGGTSRLIWGVVFRSSGIGCRRCCCRCRRLGRFIRGEFGAFSSDTEQTDIQRRQIGFYRGG